MVARWKGSTHDSRIWLNSSLCAKFESEAIAGYLLGDNGYACSTFLLTPLLNPRTASERRYNSAHIKTRNCIERCFGVWKNRFLCLRQRLRFCPKRCCNVIIATACLHNFAISHNDYELEIFEPSPLPYEVETIYPHSSEVNVTREYVINAHFSS